MTRLVVTASLVALAATSPPATAAGTYAGWIGEPTTGNAMVVTTDDAGRSADWLAVAFDADCTDGRHFAFHRRIPVGRRNRHGLWPSRNAGGVLRGRIDTRSGNRTLEFREHGRVTGRFRPGTARGRLEMTIEAVSRRTGRSVATCSSGLQHWHLQRGLGRVYGGTTGQGEPVALVLTAGRTMIDTFRFGWHGSCTAGGGVDIPGYFPAVPVAGDRFADMRVYTDGEGSSLGFDFSGLIGLRAADGKVAVAVVTPQNGTCLAANFRWRARSG